MFITCDKKPFRMLIESVYLNYAQANHSTPNNIRCIRCPSLILRHSTNSSSVVIDTVELPQLKKDDLLSSHQFIRISNMMLFENIGVSRPCSDLLVSKYLLCADCEVGPIGFEAKDEDGVVCYNLAVDRVRYESIA
jgi:hypothetical protein